MPEFDYSIYYRRFHDDSAASNERTAAWQAHFLAPLMPSSREARVLDIGCGFGHALMALQKLGFYNVMGVEASPEQAESASAKGFEVHVTSDTAGFLRDRIGSYDVGLLLDVLEHIPVAQQIDFLRACHDALAPGGRLILTVPNANSPLAARWRYNDYTHSSSFTEHSLFFVLRNARFDSVTIDAEKGIRRFPRCFWRRSARRNPKMARALLLAASL